MAKIYGLFGAMTGKLADTVMSVRNGEQIARKYQPVVSNPSSPAQVETRAKLKLMSQLSAVLAPAIAIERVGNVSARNLFVKQNFGLATYANNEADVTLTSVQLTKSAVGMPLIAATRTESGINVQLDSSSSIAFGEFNADEVIYVLLSKGYDMKLRMAGMQKVSKTASPNFQATFSNVATECVVYGYAIRYNNDDAKAKYGELTAEAAETIAKIIVSRALTTADVTLTETISTTLAAPQTTTLAFPEGDGNRSKKK